MIPTREECLKILEKHGVPENVKQHILQVTRIAMFLGKRISRKEHLNLPLLEAACLLHDLDKHLTFVEVQNHGHLTAKMLKEMGYDEIIPIIMNHAGPSVNPSRDLAGWEEKILYYSDRRVNHDKIVSVKERIEYMKKRYGSISQEHMQKIVHVEPQLLALEKEILEKAGVSQALEGLK
jgi:uncharacterized protein